MGKGLSPPPPPPPPPSTTTLHYKSLHYIYSPVFPFCLIVLLSTRPKEGFPLHFGEHTPPVWQNVDSTRLRRIWFVICSPHTQFLYICHMEKSEIPPHVEEFHIQIFENTLHNVCVCQHVTQWILNSPKYKIPKHAYLSEILRKTSYADVKRSSGVRVFSAHWTHHHHHKSLGTYKHLSEREDQLSVR